MIPHPLFHPEEGDLYGADAPVITPPASFYRTIEKYLLLIYTTTELSFGGLCMMIYFSMIDTPEDKDKFEQVYLKFRYLMLHVAGKILLNHYDAEDAVHEAFIAIIKNIHMIRDLDSPQTKSLVVLIVERKAIDILRKKSRENPLQLNEDIGGIDIPIPGDCGLADAMARLPAHYRAVLLMRYDNGLTTHEIARLLNVTDSSIRKILGRAKRKLRTELQKDGVTI